MNPTGPLSCTREEGCLSDLVLDRLLAGELDGQDASVTAEKHLADCPGCSERLAALRAEQRKFPEEIWIAGAALKTRKAAQAGRSRWALPVGAVAVAMAAGLAAVTLKPLTQLASSTPGIQLKGPLSLQLAVLHPDGKQELLVEPPATLSADDKVQFLVQSRKAGWGVVVDIDANGVTTFPETPSRVPEGPKTQLGEQSFVLDASLGAETFEAVVCPDAATVAKAPQAVRQALSAGGDPTHVEGCEVAKFSIVKVPRTP